jgi:nucleotide-binding universal stress UspA family protein
VLIGNAADSIIKHSEDCEIVTMASHGFSQYHTLVLGSVAQEVLRGARCPVLIVKDKASRLSQFHHILVPLDGHPLSLNALAYAERISKSTGGELVLCRVSDRHGIPSEIISSEAESEAVDSFLADTARTLDPGLKVKTLHEFGSPSRCLLAQLESGVDLVVLTSHGEGGFNRWICGSVAENLVRASSVPLLIVRVDPPTRHERQTSASSS